MGEGGEGDVRLEGRNFGTFSEETGSCRRVLSGEALNQTYVLRKLGARWACGGGPGSTETWESVAEMPESTGRGLGKVAEGRRCGSQLEGEESRLTRWPGVGA